MLRFVQPLGVVAIVLFIGCNRTPDPGADKNPEKTGLAAKGAATHLGISPAYAGLLLKRGIIPGTQTVPGSMWWVDPAALDTPQLRQTLRALSERRRVKRDLEDRTPRIPGLSEV